MHMQSSDSVGGDISVAWSAVAAFAAAVDADLDKWLSTVHRIGLTEFRSLVLLVRAPDKELRVSELAQRLGLNQSSATRLVTRMETKGLARRDVCEDDGRGIYAVLTDQGEHLLREVRGPYEDRVRSLLEQAAAHFPHVDVKRLGTALDEVAALLPS